MRIPRPAWGTLLVIAATATRRSFDHLDLVTVLVYDHVADVDHAINAAVGRLLMVIEMTVC